MLPEARTWPERCSGCGYHEATQGCACKGTLKFARRHATGDEWAIFLTALRTATREGRIRQSAVRPLIRGQIEPKHIGLLYRRAKAEGLIAESDAERSDDIEGRNAGRWEPTYLWSAAA